MNEEIFPLVSAATATQALREELFSAECICSDHYTVVDVFTKSVIGAIVTYLASQSTDVDPETYMASVFLAHQLMEKVDTEMEFAEIAYNYYDEEE